MINIACLLKFHKFLPPKITITVFQFEWMNDNDECFNFNVNLHN